MEEEALRNHCGRMICRVREKQRRLRSSEGGRHKHGAAAGRERTGSEGRGLAAGDVLRDHRGGSPPLLLPDCAAQEGDRTSLSLMCQGPEVQPVPPQLISMLRLKTFKEKTRRAAEVELRGPAVCSVCEQGRASLALGSFIRRKKTQLQFQTLKGRLNTHSSDGDCARWGSLCKISQSPSMPLAGFGRHYSVDICGSQQPGVALATTKERGVAPATDEMRGYPDKNATGTHLASPRCPFSDR